MRSLTGVLVKGCEAQCDQKTESVRAGGAGEIGWGHVRPERAVGRSLEISLEGNDKAPWSFHPRSGMMKHTNVLETSGDSCFYV